MIPLCVPNLTGREGEYLAECIRSTFVSTVGPFVTRFEDMVAQAADSQAAVATSSGTTGLHVALVAAGVAPGDLVVLPSLTFIASANAISHCGAVPWLMDVDADSWTLDPVLMERELAASTRIDGQGRVIHQPSGRRVAAIMPVYTLGMPADMDAVVAIARRHGLPVVADSAAALGATYKGRKPGKLNADLTVFSFNGNKTVTCGGGGAVVSDNAQLLALVRHLSTTARVGADYDHDRVGFNYRLTNVQAAVGCAQMERLDEFIAAKRRIDATYRAAFGGHPFLGQFPAPDWARSACWFSGLTLTADAPAAADIRATLKAGGIEARAFWKPMHLQAPYAEAPRSPMPICEGLWQRVMTLPCGTALTESEQQYVIAKVLESLA